MPQLTIEPVPFDAAEGTDVLFILHNVPENAIVYNWFKGINADFSLKIISYLVPSQMTIPGPAFSGGEKIYSNGSLLLQKVTLNDTGFYTLRTVTADAMVEFETQEFHVHKKLPKPNITINNSQPMEGEDPLALTCEPEYYYEIYLWKINNQRISDGGRLMLSNNNRILTLFNVTRNDTGPYECETQNPVSVSHSDPLTLSISYGPDTPIISPSDSHFHPGTNLHLFCHADSNPPAQYSWSLNGRPLESTQELSVPNLSTNNSGSYVCVAHNSVTNLNRTTTKNRREDPRPPCGGRRWHRDWGPGRGGSGGRSGVFPAPHKNWKGRVQQGLRDPCTPASPHGQGPSYSSIFLVSPPTFLHTGDPPKQAQGRVTVNPYTAQTPPFMWDQDKSPVPGHKSAVPIYQVSVVSLLTFWNPQPTVQLTTEPVPFNAAEGTDVLLLVHNASQNIIGYNWFKGKTTDGRHEIVSYIVSIQVTILGSASSGGEKIYSNGSLLLQKVTQNHTGFYTLQTVTANARVELATGEFHVHISTGLVAQPSLRATNTEPHSVAMTCFSGDLGISITWIFNSQTLQLTDRMQLSPDHRTLSIDPVRQEDAGEYQCEASTPASSTRSDRYRLAVISEERTPGLPVGAVAGIVTGVLVGVALVAALGCFLLHTRTGRYPGFPHLIPPRAVSSKASETPAPQHHHMAKVPLTAPSSCPLSLATNLQFPSTRESGLVTLQQDLGQALLCQRILESVSGEADALFLGHQAPMGHFLPDLQDAEPVTPPHLTASNTRVAEGDSVQMTCVPTDTEISIQWLLNNKTLQLTDSMQLSSNNSILTIHLVLKMDEGEYRCQVSNPVSSQKSNPITLTVIGPVTSMASETTALLQQDPAKVPLTAPPL
ncbi:hypothetical protein H1C71_039171, partial [Ictidomys tridecemlineatus]